MHVVRNIHGNIRGFKLTRPKLVQVTGFTLVLRDRECSARSK